jgi:excinuclease UvrABC ATPase subunit
VDIGPEAGAEGGEIVATGPPEEIAKSRLSRTAPFLREVLRTTRRRKNKSHPERSVAESKDLVALP